MRPSEVQSNQGRKGSTVWSRPYNINNKNDKEEGELIHQGVPKTWKTGANMVKEEQILKTGKGNRMKLLMRPSLSEPKHSHFGLWGTETDYPGLY